VEDISMTKPEEEKKSIKDTKFSRMLQDYWGVDDWIGLGLAAAGVFYYLFKGMLINYPGWHAFYDSIHAELIGIGVTVLILGNANQHMRIQQEKRRLILQMGSPDNAFAIEAVRQLRARGWLFDGTVNGAFLQKASLVGADLSKAVLINANLFQAHLERANIRRANLQKANLDWAQLKGADLSLSKLNNSNIKGSNLVDTNLSYASLNRVNLSFSKLPGAQLYGAQIDNSILYSTDLSKIYYDENTTWIGSKYNIGENGTKWPNGFDPQAAGCILVEDE
jgi:uncharacterized protein YjbI with pentapeptide repeats